MTDQIDRIDDLKVSVRGGEVLLRCFDEEWRLDGRETRKLISDLREALEALQVTDRGTGRTRDQILAAVLQLTDRGTGRTRNQILAAQYRAVFLTREPLDYAIRLANRLNRRDLMVLPVSALHDRHRFMGRGISEVIVDHAVILSERERATLDWLRLLIGRRG